jgi:RNA polymerase sigma factor for flagellar operon FliA
VTPGPARDALVCDHLPFARLQAVKVAQRFNIRITEDLVGYATEGLVQAANAYDPSRNASFKWFAKKRVRGAVVDGLRSQQWSRGSRKNSERRYGPLSLDDVVVSKGEDDLTFADLLEDPGQDPESILECGWDAAIVRHSVDLLSTKRQLVLRLYYWEGWPLARIGLYLGVSESRVSQIHSEARRRLRSLITEQIQEEEERGLDSPAPLQGVRLGMPPPATTATTATASSG